MTGKVFWLIFDGLCSLLSLTRNQTFSSHQCCWVWTQNCSEMSEFQIVQYKLRIPLKYYGLGLPVHVIIQTDGRTQNATWIHFLWYERGVKKMPKAAPNPNIVQCISNEIWTSVITFLVGWVFWLKCSNLSLGLSVTFSALKLPGKDCFLTC